MTVSGSGLPPERGAFGCREREMFPFSSGRVTVTEPAAAGVAPPAAAEPLGAVVAAPAVGVSVALLEPHAARMPIAAPPAAIPSIRRRFTRAWSNDAYLVSLSMV